MALTSPPAQFPAPAHLLYPTSDFDESLNAFMSQMAVADLTAQPPSPSSEIGGWVSESPSPVLHHDSGLYFTSPILDAGHLMATLPDIQVHQAFVSDFSDELQQYFYDVFRPGCVPVDLSQSIPCSDVPWPTDSGDPNHWQISPAQTTRNHHQQPVRTFLPYSSSEEPTHHIKPTCLLQNHKVVDTNGPNGSRDTSYQRDPRAMRECLMLQAEGIPLADAFRKSAKDVVATPNTRRASSARRKYAARFTCPIDGCNDDFTRKHNLDNHLRSHCGITDLICDVCHQGFTTIPVWKRHKKNCRHASRLNSTGC